MTIRFQEFGEFVPNTVIEGWQAEQFGHMQRGHFGERIKAIFGSRFFESVAEQ